MLNAEKECFEGGGKRVSRLSCVCDVSVPGRVGCLVRPSTCIFKGDYV